MRVFETGVTKSWLMLVRALDPPKPGMEICSRRSMPNWPFVVARLIKR